MGTIIKGIFKGFKCSLTQMFVVKEEEMEIGGPTDVKHVAHIGVDGSSGTAPSWMNEYKTGNDFAETSIGNSASGSSGLSPWSSREFGDSMSQQPSETSVESTEVAVVKKKERRKKAKASTSPKSNNGSSSERPSRAGKAKPKFIEDNSKPANIEVV